MVAPVLIGKGVGFLAVEDNLVVVGVKAFALETAVDGTEQLLGIFLLLGAGQLHVEGVLVLLADQLAVKVLQRPAADMIA